MNTPYIMKHNYTIILIFISVIYGLPIKAISSPDFSLFQNASTLEYALSSEEMPSDFSYYEEAIMEPNQDFDNSIDRQIRMENGRGYVIIRINDNSAFNKLKATFWDMTGKQIMAVALNNADNMISTEKLKRGIYCLRIEEQGNTLHVFKIIKQ